MREGIEIKKYFFVLLITTAIFFTAFYISNYLNDKKLTELKTIENRIAIDILSSETQYSLLAESSCQNIGASVLSEELGPLGEKLAFAEESRGTDNPEVIALKKSYSLLLIKDYLLMNKISEKCKLDPVFILYFYSNEGDCPDCVREGYVLTRLREKYPTLRIYAFDYNLPLSAVKTLVSIKRIGKDLPALVINDKAYYGLRSVEEIEAIIPEIKALAETASSTPGR
ncbi:MAG: hypothetical protein U1D31_01690 [Patescibacteria group bacterium]|nr:hypothetical protein [bacterium]MDZ4240819.1 hypothetical protein [Patescibacteria group bacterium]